MYSQTEEAQVFRYEYEDGEWEQTSLDWISQLFEGRDVYLQEIWESADGVQVAAGMGGNMDAHIARSMDGQTGALVISNRSLNAGGEPAGPSSDWGGSILGGELTQDFVTWDAEAGE